MYMRTVVQQYHSTPLSLTGFSGQQLLHHTLLYPGCDHGEVWDAADRAHSDALASQKVCSKNNAEGSSPPPIGRWRESPALYGLTVHHLSESLRITGRVQVPMSHTQTLTLCVDYSVEGFPPSCLSAGEESPSAP